MLWTRIRIFTDQLIEKYFHSYWPDLGLERDAFFQLGIHPENPGAGFNMTAFSLRLSGFRNAVSKRHAQVSKEMWRSLWPDVPQDQVPIDYVTNGVLHLSILDGWWVEGFNGKNGWAVEHDPSSAIPDSSDAEKIYRILEDEIITLYYKKSESGVPQDWVKAMKAAMKSNAARFSARRMVKEYIEKFYSKGMR